MAQEHKSSISGREENGYPLYSVFLPFFPTLIFLPHPRLPSSSLTKKPRGFLQPGIFARGSRTLVPPNSQPSHPGSTAHISAGGAGWTVGLNVSHTRACVCSAVGSVAVRLQTPGLSKVWPFFTMAPLTGLQKLWYAVREETHHARKRPLLGGSWPCHFWSVSFIAPMDWGGFCYKWGNQILTWLKTKLPCISSINDSLIV